jgi:hypothetical protein
MNNLARKVLVSVFNLLDDDNLRSLCCCCTLFNNLIQPRIFYRLELVQVPGDRSITFEAFRQFLERSPHLAHYPREVMIMMHAPVTEDTLFVLAALTGKNASLVYITTDGDDWSSPAVKGALEISDPTMNPRA